jgi:bifunctional non-homologous end joining protein LigD
VGEDVVQYGAVHRLPHLEPMLVSTGAPPDGKSRVAIEPKWDGVRCLTYVSSTGVRLETRRGRIVTRHAPEVAGLAEAFPGQDAILDGELITLDDAGRPGFYAVLRRLALSRETSIASGQRRSPLTFLAFDVLWLDGSSLLDQPYEQRRLHLESLNLSGPAWQTSPSYVEDSADVFAVCTALGLEGIVVKTLDSRYRPGVRSRYWVKHKSSDWRRTHEQRRRPHFARH